MFDFLRLQALNNMKRNFTDFCQDMIETVEVRYISFASLFVEPCLLLTLTIMMVNSLCLFSSFVMCIMFQNSPEVVMCM